MVALAWHVQQMTVREFLRWDPGDGLRYELVDGEPRLMAPTANIHGILQSEVCRLIGNHLREHRTDCTAVANPGVIPCHLSAHNFRIPGVGVSCAPALAGESSLIEPVLLVEILSPNNKADTWSNVWTYTSIRSLQEVLVLHTTHLAAQLLRRSPAGEWPEKAEDLTEGTLVLASIDFSVTIADIYELTGLAD